MKASAAGPNQEERQPLNSSVRSRLRECLGSKVVEERAVSGGYTPALRRRIRLQSGEWVFVKVARNDYTRRALERELSVLTELQGLGASFAPAFIASDRQDPDSPLLVLEDLGEALWPPPWSPSLIEEVMVTLDQLHSTRTQLAPYSEVQPESDRGWQQVAENPNPLLGLKLCSRPWLEASLPRLIDHEMALDPNGPWLTHFDLRSDNLCRTERGVVLIDWNFACAGNPLLDQGFWLPSLQAEGGPSPETLIGEQPEIAAFVSGFFAARAGLPPIPSAPHVRKIQRTQLRTALQWAIRALRLPASAEQAFSKR